MKEEYEQSIDSDVVDFETPFSHQDEEYHSTVNNNTDSVNSNGEKAEENRYNSNVNTTAEGNAAGNVSSNLDDVAATTCNSTTTTKSN